MGEEQYQSGDAGVPDRPPDREVAGEQRAETPGPIPKRRITDAGLESREADGVVAALEDEIDLLERILDDASGSDTYRRFWNGVRAMNQRLATMGPAAAEQALPLRRRLTALCRRARTAEAEHRTAAERIRSELLAALDLAGDLLTEKSTASDVEQVRADLAIVRERLDVTGTILGRTGRHAIWQRWQSLNQAAWRALTEQWQAGATSLESLLDEAESAIATGHLREARERLQTFRTAVASTAVSGQSRRELERRAGALWKRCATLAREQHQRYLEHTERRVKVWRASLGRQERARAHLAREVERVQRQAAAAPTDVGAALLRGQATQQQRSVVRLDGSIRELEQRIRQAEETLRRG